MSNAHRLDEPIRRIRVGRDMEVVRKKVIILQHTSAYLTMADFYETLKKKDSERCIFINSIANFVALGLKSLQMILKEFKGLKLIF